MPWPLIAMAASMLLKQKNEADQAANDRYANAINARYGYSTGSKIAPLQVSHTGADIAGGVADYMQMQDNAEAAKNENELRKAKTAFYRSNTKSPWSFPEE